MVAINVDRECTWRVTAHSLYEPQSAVEVQVTFGYMNLRPTLSQIWSQPFSRPFLTLVGACQLSLVRTLI